MDNDDLPVGRVLTRREALLMLGTSGAAAWLAACGTDSATGAATTSSTELPANSCVVKPAMTIGPYFVDEKLNRSDIRSDPSDGSVRPGTPLALTFNVSRLSSGACTVLSGALVDVWHCDHLGIYSDVSDPGFNTVGRKFLRGYQVTDLAGAAAFTTIYPGWYSGRTVHIHYRIRSASSSGTGFDFVSQLFFDDTLTDQVFAQQPYAVRGARNTRNANDGIYGQGGSSGLLTCTPDGSGGYRATFNVAVQA